MGWGQPHDPAASTPGKDPKMYISVHVKYSLFLSGFN